MTDQSTTPEPENEREPWSPENDPDGFTLEDIRPKDWYLDTLLDLIVGPTDQNAGSISMTLQVGGAVVTGMVISRKEWIDTTVESLHKASGDSIQPLGDGIRKLYDFANSNTTERHDRRDAEELPLAARRFIHMRDVHITVGGAQDYFGLPLWRAPLADVSGWTLGAHNGSDE
ncbi:hypothetical protein XM82_004784 [Salmonella enterica subsp. enterica serovar Haifa]|nr:hypothetical protein [Salmonella enterica subsp. enterica serovar Haifa]